VPDGLHHRGEPPRCAVDEILELVVQLPLVTGLSAGTTLDAAVCRAQRWEVEANPFDA